MTTSLIDVPSSVLETDVHTLTESPLQVVVTAPKGKFGPYVTLQLEIQNDDLEWMPISNYTIDKEGVHVFDAKPAKYKMTVKASKGDEEITVLML